MLVPLLAAAALVTVLREERSPPRAARPAGGSDATVPRPRIVSLLPAASALLVALGAEAHVVARATDDPTPELADRPTAGFVLSPSPEAVVAARPDLVVAWAGADTRALRGALTRGTLLPLRVDRLADVGPAALRLATAVGRAGRGRALADSLAARLAAVERAAAGAVRPAALWIVGVAPLVAAGPGTLPDDLLRVAGGRNVLAGAAVPWPSPSMERLVRLDPDVIVWPTGQGLPQPDALAADPRWRLLSAVRDARIVVVDADLVHEAGPRVAETALLLSRLLRDRGRVGRRTPPAPEGAGGPHARPEPEPDRSAAERPPGPSTSHQRTQR